MSRYCHTHGFHPVGVNHDSKTCEFKQKDKHQNNPTYSNRMGRSTYWPLPIQAAIGQQDHPAWKGKSKPE